MGLMHYIIVYFLESAFFASVTIFAYYSLQSAKLMKGSRGRQIMAVGAMLFVVAGVIGIMDTFFFTDIGLHLSAFTMWIVALFTFTFGGFLAGKAIQRVYLRSLVIIAWEHTGSIYNLIGISALIFIGIPLYLLDILYRLSDKFLWLSILNVATWTFCFVNLALAAKIHCLSEVKTEREQQEEAIPIRDDILAAKAYGTLVNTFLPAMKPISGLFRETLVEYFEYNPILFEGCRLKRDGTIEIDPVIRNVDRIHRENRIQDICTIFSALGLKLLDLYGAVTSLKHAREILARSYIATREVYGESPVLYDILRSLPEGVLPDERVSLLPREELEARVSERTRELEESRSYINNIVRSMTDMLIVVDPDGRIRTINKSTEELLGYDERELIGQPFGVLLAAEEASQFGRQWFNELTERGSVRNIEWTYLPRDGRAIPVLSSYSVMRDDEGKAQGFVCVAQDITERKLAEEREEKYIRDTMFLSRTAMGFVELAPENDIYEFTGARLKELVGDSIVAITSFNMGSDAFYIRAIVGIEEHTEKFLDPLGVGTAKIPIKMKPEARQKLTSGKLVRISWDLHESTIGKIPKDIVDEVRKTFGLDDIYAMGFTTEGELLGAASILMRKDTRLEDHSIIETFINQASIAIRRRQAEEQTKASLAEKEVLLKEIHHRVKNNLQVISSLLSLQSDYINNEQALQMFRESQNRVRSMALIHEKLYQSTDLARIDFAGYVQELANYLVRMYGANLHKIGLDISIDDISLDIDTAIPCGLIINELVSNSLKYGFPAKDESLQQNSSRGKIRIGLRSDGNGRLILTVSDNGIGFPKDLDFRNTESLGLQLVNTLTEQLEGEIQLDKEEGTVFTITFAAPE